MENRIGSAGLKTRTARKVALGLVAGHNFAQNSLLNQKGYVLSNALVAASLVGLGRSSGASLTAMGLRPSMSSADMRMALAATASAATLAIAVMAHPGTRVLLLDERARNASRDQICQLVLLRFPLGTALFEEIAFRGALPQLLARTDRTGDLLSSALFGLWHVLPTARIRRGNLVGIRSGAVGTVATGSLAAAIVGRALARTRRSSGSVVLPWLLHAMFNITSYLAGVIAWRLEDAQSR